VKSSCYPHDQAADVARAIVAWRNRVNGFGSDQQAQLSDAAKKKLGNDQPFTDVRQLAQVPSFPTAWLDPIAPLATVFGNETVNPLTAPADVIAALPGIDRARLETFLETRRASPMDESRMIATLGPAQRYVKTAKRQAFSVLVAATLIDGYTAEARAVIVVLSEDVEPYRVLVWTPVSSGRSG
jgi:general secretion pathway protein K